MSFKTLQIIADFLFLFLIVYLYIMVRRKGALIHKAQESIEEFKKLLSEATRFSKILIEEFDEYKKDFEKILDELHKTQKELKESEEKVKFSLKENKSVTDVLALYNQGLSIDEISKGLNIPRGEVELIIGVIDYIKKKNVKKD